MNIIITIIVSILTCFLYDMIKIKLSKIKLEKLKEEDMFSMFEEYFK